MRRPLVARGRRPAGTAGRHGGRATIVRPTEHRQAQPPAKWHRYAVVREPRPDSQETSTFAAFAAWPATLADGGVDVG